MPYSDLWSARHYITLLFVVWPSGVDLICFLIFRTGLMEIYDAYSDETEGENFRLAFEIDQGKDKSKCVY